MTTSSTTIYIGTDHAGFELKQLLVHELTQKNYTVIDCGAYTYDKDDDYPDFIAPVAHRVAHTPHACGIVLGGSGQGEAMVANAHRGVRATVYYGGPMDIITLSREHNDANILSLGAQFLSPTEALEAVTRWLDTPFSGDARHVRRIAKMNEATRVECMPTHPEV